MLDQVTIGWVWLQRTLNTIIDTVNQQKPLPSASIAVEESPNGTLLKVTAQPSDQQTQQTQQPTAPVSEKWPTGVGWNSMIVMDASSGTCVPKYIWYWGTGPSLVATPQPAMPQ